MLKLHVKENIKKLIWKIKFLKIEISTKNYKCSGSDRCGDEDCEHYHLHYKTINCCSGECYLVNEEVTNCIKVI